MKQKIQIMLSQLNHGLVERESAIKIALLALLTGENLVLIGPPGTGKSLVARRIADCVESGNDNADYFEYLLTKFSTPEEIFGPLSITELKADRFKRNTEGYLPTVRVAFLDEIFKASSSILNSLLTILNERIYHNGATPEKVPLLASIAASNELPTEQEELNALYDRFLVRSFVDYVPDDKLHCLFESTESSPEQIQLNSQELHEIKEMAEAVTISPEIVDVITGIWLEHKEQFKEDSRESLSDRRLKQVIKLLRVSAATNGRNNVDLSDVFLLKDCLWNHQENAIKVRDFILKKIKTLSYLVSQDEAGSCDSAEPNKSKSPQNGAVKGFKGSGTEDDPLLIENFHDLVGLERPNVGLKGYYFRQVADIDCTELTSWVDIDFKGVYDGAGHNITYKATDKNWCALFSAIKPESLILNLSLVELRLSKTVEKSHVTSCTSTIAPLIGRAIDSTISDCLVVTHQVCDLSKWESPISKDYRFAGITTTLSEGSIVERCFVTGKLTEHSYRCGFSGIVLDCDDEGNSLRNCALGDLETSAFMSLFKRIGNDSCELENNVSKDTNGGTNNISGEDGKTLAAALFKQNYFEHTLGWDFDTVWRWDEEEDRPTLCLGASAATASLKSAEQQKANMIDLLTSQVKANIWL